MQRVEDIIRYLSGQIEVDVPLIGLSGRRHNVTDVTSTPYTAALSDHAILCNVGAAASVVLPDGAGRGQIIILWDIGRDAQINPITVTAETGNISGKPSIIVNENGARVEFMYTGSEWVADSFITPLVAVPAGGLVLTGTAPSVS
jgi:hypothetical protein